MALASKYQDKFFRQHEALIGINSKLTEPRIAELLAGAGIEMDRLSRDLAANAAAIDAILARNNDQATAFDFKGTPSFIVGKFRVPGVLTMAQFAQVIAGCAQSAEEIMRLLRRQPDPVVRGLLFQRIPVGAATSSDDGPAIRRILAVGDRRGSTANRRRRRRDQQHAPKIIPRKTRIANLR